MPTYHIIVSGKVQGVFYRVKTQDKARALNLTGWVKNTDAGEVEIMATGSRQELDGLVAWCKIGPPKAEVKNVLVNPVNEEQFDTFSVLR